MSRFFRPKIRVSIQSSWLRRTENRSTMIMWALSWNSVTAFFLYTAVTLPPLFFGSRNAMVIAAWCAFLGLGLILVSPKRLHKNQLVLLGLIAFVVAIFGLVIYLQVSTNQNLVNVNPIWQKASDALGQSLSGSVTVVRDEPYFALGPSLANTLALTLGIIVGNDPRRAIRAIRLTAFAGATYAVYGIFAEVTEPSKILWRDKPDNIGSLTSTFVSRNTAASFFGSCTVIWLIFLLAAIRSNFQNRGFLPGKLLNFLLRDISRQVLFYFSMMFVCMVALMMTHSRAGVLISLAILLLTLVIYTQRYLQKRYVLVLFFVVLVAYWSIFRLAGGGVQSRIDLQGIFDDEGRFAVYRSILQMISANPLLGTGLGTFPFSFPAFRDTSSMQFTWDLAHSTFLELAAEVGIPLSVVIGFFWLGAEYILLHGALQRGKDPTIPLSVMMASLVGLFHSAIDFSLQISGYSIVIFALLGVGLSHCLRSDRNNNELNMNNRNRTRAYV